LLFQYSLCTEVPAPTTFCSCTNNFWLLVVHLAFTTGNSVYLTTTDYLLSIGDQIPTVNCSYLTSQTENQFMCGRGNSTVSLIKPGKCTPNKLYLLPFNISTSQRLMTGLSHLLGCLVRDLNYGPWPVTMWWTELAHI